MPTETPTRGAARKRRSRKFHSSSKHEAVKPMDYEPGESPEDDDVREGTEDSECCAAKAGKKKCSACAAGKPCSGGRDDSLTSQDYLLACDLGIQNRPIPYIRGRLDAMTSATSTRNDLRAPGGKGKKCGNSYIPASATCNNGQGGTGKKPMSTTRRVVGTVAAGLTGIGAATNAMRAVQSARQGKIGLAAQHGTAALFQGKATTQYARGQIGRGLRTELGGAAATAGVGALALASRDPRAKKAAYAAGRATGSVYNRARNMVGRPKLNTVEGFAMGGGGGAGRPRGARRAAAYRRARGAAYAAGRATGRVANMFRPRGRRLGGPLARRDSVWAEGFTFDPAVFNS